METLSGSMGRAGCSCETARDGAGDLKSVACLLWDCEPSLLLLADPEGRLVAADDFGTGIGLDAAGLLAAELAAHLAGVEICRFDVPTRIGSRLGFGIRLLNEGPRPILGGLVPEGEASGKRLDMRQTALQVCGTFAWTADRCRADCAAMRAQIQELFAERQALQISHTEAITAAIEEHEERLRDQRDHAAQLQAVLMTAADGIITADEKGNIESFNEAAGWMFGYSAGDAIGRNISILMSPPYCDRYRKYLAEYLRTGKTGFLGYGREVTGQRKDGTTFPLELSISEVLSGGQRKFTAIARDITERTKAEEELGRLHLQNELILNSAGEGIFGMDRSGKVMFVNPAAARMLGWELEQLIGCPSHEAFHHKKRNGLPYPSTECPINATLREGTTPRVDNEVFWKRDGTSFPVEYTSMPIREDGEIVGAVVTFCDITERKLLERQLAQAQKLESIGQLAAGIAHEINTPTQYIGDNVRFLEDAFQDLVEVWSAYCGLRQTAEVAEMPEGAPARALAAVAAVVDHADVEYLMEEVPKAIGQSLEGVDRVATIVRSMKEFSHPGTERRQAIDLNRAIESTLTVSRNEWKYVADAVTDLDPGLPLVSCLAAECNQVLLNLIINAAHAISEKLGEGSAEKGTIRVSTRHDHGMVEIRVEDTGAGIPEESRSRVFDPFFTTKEVGRGTGQGLAIAHSVVTEKHGGTIDFETQLGRGTTFMIRLPIDGTQSSSGSGQVEEAGGQVEEANLVCR